MPTADAIAGGPAASVGVEATEARSRAPTASPTVGRIADSIADSSADADTIADHADNINIFGSDKAADKA